MKKNQVTPNTFGEFEGVHPKGSIWSALKKGGRSLPTSPRLLELVSRLIDIILCVNNLSTLLMLTIVKPYLSTNKQLHYITLHTCLQLAHNLCCNSQFILFLMCFFMRFFMNWRIVLKPKIKCNYVMNIIFFYFAAYQPQPM